MSKCRYIPLNQLSLASDAHVHTIHKALVAQKIQIGGTALNMVLDCWKIRVSAFIEAIRSHIESKHYVYYKKVSDPPKDCTLFEANIRLDPDSTDEDDDVYVEIRLTNNILLVTVRDAHPHHHYPRLPRQREL